MSFSSNTRCKNDFYETESGDDASETSSPCRDQVQGSETGDGASDTMDARCRNEVLRTNRRRCERDHRRSLKR